MNNLIPIMNEKIKDRKIIFLAYLGEFTQTIIAGLMDILEKESEKNELKMKTATNLYVIFIELAQNVLKYSSSDPKGFISITEDDNWFYINCINEVNEQSKEKITQRLNEIKSLDKAEIKKRYKELRKSGKHTHEIGGGIGFYEIAKKADEINFEFTTVNNKDLYHIEIKIKK